MNINYYELRETQATMDFIDLYGSVSFFVLSRLSHLPFLITTIHVQAIMRLVSKYNTITLCWLYTSYILYVIQLTQEISI